MALYPSFRIFSSFAIAEAVVIWSPVIMMVLIPALLATSIASLTSGLAGSIIPTKPRKVKFSSKFSLHSGLFA